VAEHVTEGDSGGVNDIASPAAAGPSNTGGSVGNSTGGLGGSGGESNITTKYGGYRTGGSPRTADAASNTSGGGPNPMARSAQAAPVGRRLSGGRVSGGGGGGGPTGGPGVVAFGSGSSRSFNGNGKNNDVGSRSFNSNTNEGGSSRSVIANTNNDVGSRSFNSNTNNEGGSRSFNSNNEGNSSRSFNTNNEGGSAAAPAASRLRAGSTPSLGGGGRGEGANTNQIGGRAPMAMRSMSADGGGGMADYSSSHQVGNSRATAGLGGISEADIIADGGRSGGGGGGIGGMGTGIGGRGIGGSGIGSGSHPVDTYSNPSTDDDEDFETPTAANTPPSSAGGVAGGFTTPPRGNSPGVNTKSSSSPGTSVSNGPDAGTGINNNNNNNSGTPTAGTPSTSAPPSAFAPEAADKNFRAPSGRHLRAPSAATSEQNASTPFSPGKSDASSSLFSTQSGIPGGGRSGSFDVQPGSANGGGGGGNGMGPSSRFVQSGKAMTGISEASLPPGAIHEEHHDHHSWNTRTQVPTSPILGEGGRPIGSHTFSAIGAGSHHEGFATDRYNSADAGAARPGQQGRLEGMPVAAGGAQPSFSGPMASGGSGAGLPTERSGAMNFGGQQGPVAPVGVGGGSGGLPTERNGTMNFGGPQVATGPVRHESGTRPVLNQQGVPVGEHAFSRSAVGTQSPPVRERATRPILNEGGAPVGSRSLTRAGAGSHSDKFAADRINTGPAAAGPTAADYTRTGHTGDLHVLPYQPTRIPGPPHSAGGGMSSGGGTPTAAMGGMTPQGQQGGQPFVHHEHHNAAAGPGSPLARFSGQQQGLGSRGGSSGDGRPAFLPMQGMQPMPLGSSAGGAQRGIGNGGKPAGGMGSGSMGSGGAQPGHRVGGIMPPALGGMGPGSSMALQMGGGMPPMPHPAMGAMGSRGPMGGMPPALGMGSSMGSGMGSGMGGGMGGNNGGSSNSLQGSGSSSASGDGAVAEAGSRRGFSSFSSFTPIGAVAPTARSAAASS
jgi:hypothetical protein